MAQLKKHAAFLEQLHSMVVKEAKAGTATGKPGGDTHPVSVSESTEHVDKNKEGKPETNPQEFKQEKAKDPSDPTKTHKKADETAPEPEKVAEVEKEAKTVAPQVVSNGKPEEAKEAPHKVEQKEVKIAAEAPTNEKLAELGKQLLEAIGTINKQATTAGTATGKPGADTHYTSVDPKHDHVNKNEEGHPEHNPQEFKQEKAKDPSDPTKAGHKAAEEADLDKEASYALGREFARTFLASKTASSSDMYKEAGKRDFDQLIAQAAAELENEAPQFAVTQPKSTNVKTAAEVAQVDEAEQIKQAEEAGSQAFYAMLKQAQEEEQANQVKLAFEQRVNQLLAEKQAAELKAAEAISKLAAHEVTMQKKAEEDKLDAKLAALGQGVVESVIARLKQTPA